MHTPIHHALLFKNHEGNKETEEGRYKFSIIRKLTIIFHCSIENNSRESYKKFLPKPMPLTKIFQMIDENPDNLKDWGGKFNCPKHPVFCKK